MLGKLVDLVDHHIAVSMLQLLASPSVRFAKGHMRCLGGTMTACDSSQNGPLFHFQFDIPACGNGTICFCHPFELKDKLAHQEITISACHYFQLVLWFDIHITLMPSTPAADDACRL